MTMPHDLEVVDDLAILRFSGEQMVAEAASRVTEALIFARERQLRKLLVNTLGATMIGQPTVAGSYFRIQEWARAADGFVRLALVLRPSAADPRGVGLTMAANSGLIGNAFTSEGEALKWLHGTQGAASHVRKTADDPRS